MKKYGIAVLIAAFMVSITVSAQQATENQYGRKQGKRWTQREMAEKRTPKKRADRMAKELNLTPEQTQKVQALFEKEKMEREKMVEQRKAENNIAGAKMRDAHQADLEQIIGKEKMTQWNERGQKMKERGERGMRNANDSVSKISKPMKKGRR